MALKNLFSDSSARILMLMVTVFAVISVLMIPAYFHALRPRRGTTEWMKRLDQPKFAALSAYSLHWMDILWAFLAGVCAGALRLLSSVFFYLHRESMELLPQVMNELALFRILPGAVIGISLFLLLRGMYGNVLPSFLGAVIGGLVQIGNTWYVAFLCMSLVCLWFWTASEADAPMFPRALLFLGSLAFYGVVLYFDWAVIWLSPLYLAAYLYVQIHRWKYGPKKSRGISLTVSLLLLLLTAVLAIVSVWVLHCVLTEMPEKILDLPYFFALMTEKITLRLRWIVQPWNFFGSIFANDVFLFVMGMAALVPVFHGLVKIRDSRCIALLAMVPCFFATWLLGGVYLMVPLLIPLVGWVWNILTERERSWEAAGFAAALALFFLVQHFT